MNNQSCLDNVRVGDKIWLCYKPGSNWFSEKRTDCSREFEVVDVGSRIIVASNNVKDCITPSNKFKGFKFIWTISEINFIDKIVKCSVKK